MWYTGNRIKGSNPFVSATKIKRPIWAFYFCVGVAVWTNRSQSAIAGNGALVDENEPFGEV